MEAANEARLAVSGIRRRTAILRTPSCGLRVVTRVCSLPFPLTPKKTRETLLACMAAPAMRLKASGVGGEDWLTKDNVDEKDKGSGLDL